MSTGSSDVPAPTTPTPPELPAPSVHGRFRTWLRRTRRRVRAFVRRVVWRWRSSMQLRVVTSALVVGVAAVAGLGAILSDSIRDGLFEQRLEQVDLESARSTEQAQARFASATPTSADEVQQLLTDMLNVLQAQGSGSRHVFLWRTEGESSPGVDLSTAPQLESVITEDMRQSTRDSNGQVMQPVAISENPSDPGARKVPGVVVGSTVQVPGVGTYELYYLYSFEPEQQTLRFLQSVLLLGAAALVALLGIITWIVTRQAVRPVRGAAQVAERLADGHLDERLPVKGHDEMATLARSFNEMAESLQEQIGRMEELSLLQRRFVSDVSHELRTPLTTIRMAGEVLHASKDGFDPASRRSAELLQTQLDRFEDLLADLLEISRFDAGAAVLDAERRDLRDVINSVVDQWMPLAERKGVWLSVHLPEERAAADVDPRRVERIVRNLVANAIEHAEERPVEITVASDQHAVAIVVRDHGVGMTEEESQHVFDRFWRADPARARTIGGTGLGLAISLEDAHLHGGWLDVWGRPAQGASFRLTLPRRAGIHLVSSPLPLVPLAPTSARGLGMPTWENALEAATSDPADGGEISPAALPDMADTSDGVADEADPQADPRDIRSSAGSRGPEGAR